MKIVKRVFGFDAGHRVINHPGKCQHFHGHRYYGEIGIAYKEVGDLGYAIDFGDIKKLALATFDEFFDHGMILNPSDPYAKILADGGEKVYTMSYYGDQNFRNPTAENIAVEMLCMLGIVFENHTGLSPAYIDLYETPNCSVIIGMDDVSLQDISGFDYHKADLVRSFVEALDCGCH